MNGTIKSKDEIERLFHEGRRSSSYLMTVLAIPKETSSERGRCAFIAGKKLGVAPTRSRCKRVMRELARELGAPWDGYDVAFVARRKVAHAKHSKAVSVLSKQLEELEITR